MSKGKWTHGERATVGHEVEFRQCNIDDCGEWIYWRDEKDHQEHEHGIFADADEPDPLHVRVANLKAYIERTTDDRLRYELRKGLIQLEVRLAASTLDLTGGNNDTNTGNVDVQRVSAKSVSAFK